MERQIEMARLVGDQRLAVLNCKLVALAATFCRAEQIVEVRIVVLGAEGPGASQRARADDIVFVNDTDIGPLF